MGGTKKKSSNTSTKPQGSNSQAGEGKKDKKDKGSQQKARISVVLNEGQGMKILADLKAITPQALARNTGVKISVANTFIQSQESKGTVKYVGGYSGHKIYRLIQETKQKDSIKEKSNPTQETQREENST
tara:strand:- start:1141 stop:1530 length:390 start_codon:yes stop_codon:yes gene_type:complete